MEGDVGVVGVNTSDPRSKPTKKNAHTGRGGGRGSGGKGVKQDEAHGPGEVVLPVSAGKRKGRKGHARNYRWGCGYLTFKPKVSSWQATCPRCGSHAARNPGTRCTKTLKFNDEVSDNQ
eukprot:7814656-Pyramimonas_sp.AAC.1